MFFLSFQVHACKVKNTNLYGSLMKPLHELREFFIFRACTADWGSQLFQFIQLLHLQFGGQSPAFTPASLNQSNLFILLDRCRLSSDALSAGSSWSLATVWIWTVAVVSVLQIDGYSDQVGKFQPHPNFTPILLACILLRWVFFKSTYKALSVQLHNAGSASQRLLTHPRSHILSRTAGGRSKIRASNQNYLFYYYFELQRHHRFMWTSGLPVNHCTAHYFWSCPSYLLYYSV